MTKAEILRLQLQLAAAAADIEKWKEQGSAVAGARVKRIMKDVSRRTGHYYDELRFEMEAKLLLRRGEIVRYKQDDLGGVLCTGVTARDFATHGTDYVLIHPELISALGEVIRYFGVSTQITRGFVPPGEHHQTGRKGRHCKGMAVRFKLESISSKEYFQLAMENRFLADRQVGVGEIGAECYLDIRNYRKFWISKRRDA